MIATKRIIRDMKEIVKNPLIDNGIHVHFNEDNINNVYVLMIGPEDTPYEGGFFFFHVFYPKEYPIKPPEVKYLTQGNNVRFNPNLYTNGKVCLSILNTWNGPGWTPCLTLSSVLLSIQGMVLVKDPLRRWIVRL